MDSFLPYFAGFFDGEGSIGVYSNGQGHGRTLRVTITQSVGPEATELLMVSQRRWGGALTLMNHTYKRPAWSWQVSATKGVKTLRDIRPWLRLKAEQADIALTYWKERECAERGSNGRFLPLTRLARQQGLEVEAALKAAKRGLPFSFPSIPSGVGEQDEPFGPPRLW